jgi:hypothetical protein
MAKIDLLRQLIREEVTKALRQELPKILSEVKQAPTGMKNVIREMKKSEIPLTLNTAETYKRSPDFKFANSSPLNNILLETAKSMDQDDDENYNFNIDNVNPVSFFQPKDAAVGDVNGMLATARPSSDISMVQINEVPDYSQLMKKMTEKGVI